MEDISEYPHRTERQLSSSSRKSEEMEDPHSGSSCQELELEMAEEENEMRDAILDVYRRLIAFLSQDDYDYGLRQELADNYKMPDKEEDDKKLQSQDVAASEMGSLLEDQVKEKEKGMDMPSYLIVFEARIRDLQRLECGITITGETSSGKTSLVNKLVGQRLVTPKARAATSKICRIRNSKRFTIRITDVNGQLIKEQHYQSTKKMRSTLDSYTDVKSGKAYPNFHYIDIYCPLGNLDITGNVVLVDTPGIGESGDLTSMLLEYLPNSIAFIFMIDVSNAGGVQEDRVIRILEAILRNRYKMPCFDPKDVLFITNKWNILRMSIYGHEQRSVEEVITCDKEGTREKEVEDESDESEDEEEEIWETVKNKIKTIWPVFDEDTIFKLNLQHFRADEDSEDEKLEFGRFTDHLSEMSRRSRDKKIQIHLTLLKDAMRRIKRGISSRIYTAEADDKYRTILENAVEKIGLLEDECSKIYSKLSYEISIKVKNLAEKFHAYINSTEGKQDVLLRGEKPITECLDWEKNTRERVRDGMIQWLRGRDVMEEIADVERQISEKFQSIHSEIEQINALMTGDEDTEKKTDISTILRHVLEPPLWLPNCIAFGALALVPSDFQWSSQVSVSPQEIDACYSSCLASYTLEAIELSLNFIFEIHFETRIKTIFAIELRREIESIRSTISFLLMQRTYKKKELDKWYRLQGQLFNLYEEVHDLS